MTSRRARLERLEKALDEVCPAICPAMVTVCQCMLAEEPDLALHAVVQRARPGDEDFKASQRARRLNEEIFGWFKQIGRLRLARMMGRWKNQQMADVGLATLKMVRMRRPVA